MTFELVKGSGNRVVSTVCIDERNSSASVWWCEPKQEWHWSLVWEDGSGPYSTHMHNGTAPSKLKARADMVKAIIYTEDLWPRLEYFENNW
jgi:hypothetical protein